MATNLKKIRKETYPIVKWVGGKRQILFELIDNMPKSFERYFEPFIGGGALFFELQLPNSYISDVNKELINLYEVVRDDVDALISDLKTHIVSKEYFLEIRNLDRKEEYKNLSSVKKASRFIYLNRTCFNGLYRVNSKGEFNVPYGKYVNPRICDEDNLKNCSALLKNTEIRCDDFYKIIDYVKKEDFVYFDPPYVPLNVTSSFTSYTQNGFNKEMQVKLANLCRKLDKKGVKFMLSNSDTALVHELYEGFEIKKILASRAINSKGDGRGKITEVIVRNYK